MPGWLMVIGFAPFAGSFLGVLIRRLPKQQPLVLARSTCEACQRPLAPLDLVPVLSYVALHGRCRYCRDRIPAFHLQIELAALAVAVTAALLSGSTPFLLVSCVLGWTLLALAWIDWDHLILPDSLTLPLLLLGLLVAWLYQPAELVARSQGAILGYLTFSAVATTYRWLRKRDGLGAGDAKLFAAAGAWTGWQSLPAIALAAALIGIGLAIGLRMAGRPIGSTTALPFGTCLSLAIWVAWLWGHAGMPLFLG